jgi:hypothetical protein
MCHPSQDLRLEDERLNKLAKLTEEQYFKGRYGSIGLGKCCKEPMFNNKLKYNAGLT